MSRDGNDKYQEHLLMCNDLPILKEGKATVVVMSLPKLVSDFTAIDILSNEEKSRLDNFIVKEAAWEFYYSHIQLRKILSRACRISPEKIEYSYGRHGKPYLSQHPDICFNLSHCRTYIAIGLALRTEIGVDIEYIRKIKNLDLITKKFFTSQEQKYIQKYDEKESIFFKIWVQKEAIAKALGESVYNTALKFSTVSLNGSSIQSFLDPESTQKLFIDSFSEIQDHGLSICTVKNKCSIDLKIC